jgi:hypothetical protein
MSKSESRHRTWLLGFALSIFALFLWSSLVYWIALNERGMGISTTLSMFDGVGASALRLFFSSMWLPAAYAIILGVAGYCANRYAIQRVGIHNE